MQIAMFEGPVLSQVVPTVILFPSVMTQSAYQSGGNALPVERRDTEPFMFGGFSREFLPPCRSVKLQSAGRWANNHTAD